MFKIFPRITASHGHGQLFQSPKIQFKSPNSFMHSAHFRRSEQELALGSGEEIGSEKPFEQREAFVEESNGLTKPCNVVTCHPWPEWIELMKQLLRSGYLDAVGVPLLKDKLYPKDAKRIRTACLNFARDRFDLIRYLSRKDIQIVAGSGCPNIDRKVVNSAKRLRAYVGTDEGNVCSSCNLRGNCDRAYVNACGSQAVQTVDVMRILLTYGLEPVAGTVENKPCLNKIVSESTRKLLKEMVEFSQNEVDSVRPNVTYSLCPEKRLFQEKPRQRWNDHNSIPLKKGDWICDKCNFLNFAKNTKCLQCNEKPPKRQLNPGEWECDSCNYINFRRNAVCLKCEHRRPKALISENIH